jgi:hypothetical protein
MKRVAVIWTGLAVVSALFSVIFQLGEEGFGLLAGDEPPQAAASDQSHVSAAKDAPRHGIAVVKSGSTTRAVVRGEVPVLWHSMTLNDGRWKAACKDPDDPTTCSLAYRATYRLPPESDKRGIDHDFSLWMGLLDQRPKMTANMEWFDEDVAATHSQPAKGTFAQYETAGVAKGIKPDVNWFRADKCALRPRNGRFPRGSVSCVFDKTAAKVIDKMAFPPNWTQGESLSLSFTVTREKQGSEPEAIHEFHFEVPVEDAVFLALHARTMGPLASLGTAALKVDSVPEVEDVQTAAPVVTVVQKQEPTEQEKALARIGGPGRLETISAVNAHLDKRWPKICQAPIGGGSDDIECYEFHMSVDQSCSITIKQKFTVRSYSDRFPDWEYGTSSRKTRDITYTISRAGDMDTSIAFRRNKNYRYYSMPPWTQNYRGIRQQNWAATRQTVTGLRVITLRNKTSGHMRKSERVEEKLWEVKSNGVEATTEHDRSSKDVSRIELFGYFDGDTGTQIRNTLRQYSRHCKALYP